MQYLNSKKVVETVHGELAYDRVVHSFKEKSRENKVFEYFVVDLMPDWLVEMFGV
jgi:uncharacterized protein YfaS (alpha-2-macroglobulin family)